MKVHIFLVFKKKNFYEYSCSFFKKFSFIYCYFNIFRNCKRITYNLILRPFNFETFATTAYISASEDLLEAAAVPSLFLILIASFFIIITSKYILRDTND